MLIQYASDLHLEFPDNKKLLKAHPLEPKADILLLAGDIMPLGTMDQHHDFLDYVSDHFETTYWVPGNHEYYHYDIAEKCGSFRENVRSNVHLVNNQSIQAGDHRLLFTTLWSKVSPVNQWHVENGMSDFRLIRCNGGRFTAEHFNSLHEENLTFLKKELPADGKTIVVTHHVPTFMHYPEKYKGDALNEAFAVELQDLIEDHKPDYWIYGHHHSNTPEFTIGTTGMLTNQLGYIQLGEHKLFNTEKTIEV